MQREAESIDRKNGTSSGEVGDLGVGMSGIHARRVERRKEKGGGKEKNEVRDAVTTSKTSYKQEPETDKGLLLSTLQAHNDTQHEEGIQGKTYTGRCPRDAKGQKRT